MFEAQVCMVSAQAAPNLLPLLEDELKPREVILLVTDQMRERANYLQKAIRPLGIKVRQEAFSAIGNFADMQQQLLELLEAYDSNQIALNATGGTKWMAIAAQEIFSMNGSPVFYMDIDSGNVLFLDSQRAPLHIGNKIKLEQYLSAYGYSKLNKGGTTHGLTTEQRDFCQQLVLNVKEWGGALGQLNRLASEAGRQHSLRQSLSQIEHHDTFLQKLVFEMTHAKILKQCDNDIVFSSEEARFYANGGWLEEYINSRLNELKSDGVLQDSSHRGLKVRSPGGTENEIDIAFMANNRLHLIECKTSRLTGNYAGSAGKESLYKLDSISDLGGLGTKSLVASYRPLGPEDSQRAKDLKIKVVQGEDLRNIKTILRDWITGQR